MTASKSNDADLSEEVVTFQLAPVQTPVEAVLEAVGTLVHSSMRELDPLYDTIDPDNLNSLVRSTSELRIEFKHNGCLIAVTGEGEVTATLVTENV